MRRHRIPARAVWVVLGLTPGCATYTPAPLDPPQVLQRLAATEWAPIGATTTTTGDDGPRPVGPKELAAFAVATNPQLLSVRAEIGVRDALLVEAGLLPDPELSWDAMNNVASQVVTGDSSSVDTISGLGLMFPLLRPGERGARVGAAEWRIEEARRLIAAAEWTLTRDIHVAYQEVIGSEILLAQTVALTTLAGSTNDYFERAREAGAATAIQANLALGELQSIRLDGVRAEARARQARQALNGLLGLPPDAEVLLRNGETPSASEYLRTGTDELTSHAVEARPDLSVLLARYEVAEENVRLAVAKQYPLIAIGTGISISLPIFSKFGRPAMRTAIAERARLAVEFTAAVHSVREEIAAAHVLWQLAQREVELVEQQLLPTAERNIELSRAAFQAGEVTLLETLALQRALVEARTRQTETRAERSKRAWTLLAASGWLLGPETPTDTNDTTNEEDSE